METAYSPADLAFLTQAVQELHTRVQALLRKSGNSPLQRQGLSNLLQKVERAQAALAAYPETGRFATQELGTFYNAVYAQRRRIDQFLDIALCPVDKRNEMVSSASAVNALLRRLRQEIQQAGKDPSAYLQDDCG